MYSIFEEMHEISSHMQRKHGRNRLVVTDGVAHVTSVHVLRDFSRPTQPRGQTPLQCRIVGRNWGASTPKAPEDSVRPGRFPLLSTDRKGAKGDRLSQRISLSRKIDCAGLGRRILDEPGVVRVSAHVKLVSRWEVERSLSEAFQDGLCVFSHVEL